MKNFINIILGFFILMMVSLSSFAYTLSPTPPSSYKLQAGTFQQHKSTGGAVRYYLIDEKTICTTKTTIEAFSTTYKPTGILYKRYRPENSTRNYHYKADFTEDCKPQPTTPPSNTVLIPPTTAVACATENQNCVIPDKTIASVYYGVDTTWVKKDNLTGTIQCGNTVFTDPAQGYLKKCMYVATGTTPDPIVVTPPPTTPPVVTNPPTVEYSTITSLPKVAKHCAWEGGTCTIPPTMTAKVWFGKGGKWITKDNVIGSVSCTKSALGDPQTGTTNHDCFFVDKQLLAKTLDPKGQNLMPFIDKSKVPVGSAGFATPMIKAAGIPPVEGPNSAGAFRISCLYSHMNNDDPIVFPGIKDATHHHTYFGNTGINSASTTESILTTGNSTCAGGILNRSGYWMPTLVNSSNGVPAKPDVVVVYYKSPSAEAGPHVKVAPTGLKMFAGNPRPLAIAETEASFFCQDQTQVMNPANWGIMWNANNLGKSCGGPSQMLRMIVSFPQCWDGKNLDSPDHKSHMAYSCGENCKLADGKIGKTINGCPASHPVVIPSIAINADFYNLDASAKYRLSSDNYSKDIPGGYSLHADWMNGWHEPTMQRFVTNCLNNPKNCGGPNLGDGQTLYGVNQD